MAAERRKRMGMHPLAAMMGLRATTAALHAYFNRELGVSDPPAPKRLHRIRIGWCAATVANILEGK